MDHSNSSGWLFYMITLCIFLIIIYFVCKLIKRKTFDPQDTIYYQITDVLGKESIIHDSGIKPSEQPSNAFINLDILKQEIHEGKTIVLSTPSKIKIGFHPKDLSEISMVEIIEEELLYKIKVNILNNPFAKKIKID